MRIGLFGGTFDPIHLGHLCLATSLAEKHDLDQVMFCPAHLSPFKIETPPLASWKDRKEMVKLAVKGNPLFKVWEEMPVREGLSYTIDLIKDFIAEHGQGNQLFLVLGRDAIDHFDLWKNVEEIVRLAPPLTGVSKEDLPEVLQRLSTECAQVVAAGITRVSEVDINSTEIRQRLREKKSCLPWVPSIVLDYIHEHHLYSSV